MGATVAADRVVRRPVVRPTPRWWRDASGVLAWASLLIVVALWVAGGGVQQLGPGGIGLSSVGRLTGLVSADLLLLQVLLMARLPIVERAWGQDELVRRHRLVGLWSVNLMVAHVVLITLGYAATARTGVVGELWTLVVSYPGMLLATAGTAILVLVVATSVRRARSRLRYETWHLLHLYAYLGVGLALPHQLWTGSDFLDRPLATAFWWTAWAVTAGSVVLCRLGLPLWRSWRHRLVVQRVVREGPGVVSVHLTGRHLDRLPVRAGQFFTWRFLSGSGWTQGNPYSLSAAPDGRSLRITARDNGRLAALRPGTRVLFEGPYGRLTTDVRSRRKVAVLASGIGITPGLALLQEIAGPKTDAVVVHRISTEADRLFADELTELSRHRGVRVLTAVGHRVAGRPSWQPAGTAHPSDRAALLRAVPDLADRDVFVCGPPPWTEAVLTAARAAGVAPGQLHVEHFSW